MKMAYTLENVDTVAGGANPRGSWTNLDALWKAVEEPLRARHNDIHTPLSFMFAEFLLDAHPEADPLVTRIAILLHDTGWSRCDEEKIFTEGFQGDWRKSDIRRLHEIEGCNIAREVLPGLGYSEDLIKRVTDIIDGHDTRMESYSIEDSLMRDADRLWRFTPAGIALASGWFKKTPSQYRLQLEQSTYPELITEAARALASAELERSIHLLKLDVI
jgi:hypothetical protein